MVIGDVIRRNGWRFPDKIAIAFEKERLTFADLMDRSFRLCDALFKLNLRKGDCVAAKEP